MILIYKDPFDDIAEEFCKKLESQTVPSLYHGLKNLNVDRVIEELFEYIELNLKRTDYREVNVAEWG